PTSVPPPPPPLCGGRANRGRDDLHSSKPLHSQQMALCATALLSHRIVVAALELHPVGFEILRAWQILRPGLAGHHTRRLPNDVELAIPTYLADIDRLSDVVVRQHLGGAARKVG